MSVELNEAETACLSKLAAMYERGKFAWASDEDSWESLGLTGPNFAPVIGMLELYGYIGQPAYTNEEWFCAFTIKPTALQAVRELAAEKKKADNKDIIDHVRDSVRRHKVGGYLLLALIVFGLIVTIASQIISILANLKVI